MTSNENAKCKNVSDVPKGEFKGRHADLNHCIRKINKNVKNNDEVPGKESRLDIQV